MNSSSYTEPAHREPLVPGQTDGRVDDRAAQLGLEHERLNPTLQAEPEAGLVQGEIEGPRTKYCVNTTGLAELKDGIASL